MSRFFSEKYQGLTPYTPGEQPRDMQYIKLNTNESPFPPSNRALSLASDAAKRLQLYCDPTCRELCEQLADLCGVYPFEVLPTNGSDEILNFAFMAFCDNEHPAIFPDITYGFYRVFAELCGVPYREIPLCEDLSIDLSDYKKTKGTIFLANPNAPTGIALSRDAIEDLVASDKDRVVVIDEAYVDFGGESCIPLIHKYDNLLVTRTFSKSRSMAGARLGFGAACADLIQDLNTIKYSTNPYNVNAMTQAAGIGMLQCEDEVQKNCRTIMENRSYLSGELKKLGFSMTDSKTNFVFAKHEGIGGKDLYEALRAHGILVRHFDGTRICDYNRITVGTMEQMKTLIDTIRKILEDRS